MSYLGGSGPEDFSSFLELEGIPLPENSLVDEEPPEAVSEEKLSAFYRRELTGSESEWVAFLVSRYRTWHEAGLRLLEGERDADGAGRSTR